MNIDVLRIEEKLTEADRVAVETSVGFLQTNFLNDYEKIVKKTY